MPIHVALSLRDLRIVIVYWADGSYSAGIRKVALAYDIIRMRKITGPISDELMDEAVERLIRERATHLDSLVARLHETRVQRVIEPMLAGLDVPSENIAVYNDDVRYVQDLGLVTRGKPLQISNPIYQEVITRVLAAKVEDRVVLEPHGFVTPGY